MLSSRELRLASAVVTGVLFEAVFVWKFEAYSARENGHHAMQLWALPVAAFAAGLLLSLGSIGRKIWIAVALLGGMFAANACLIVLDCAQDPTNHNLWPFEFVILGVGAAPVFAGVGVSALLERIRGRVN